MVSYEYNEVIVNGVDVSSKLRDWTHDEEWGVAIDAATVLLSPEVTSLIIPAVSNSVTIKRGFASATEEFVFEGIVTQYKPEADIIVLECKGLMIETIKAARTKSWDKDIDDEGGVGSEIAKDILDDSSLDYTPAKGVLTDGSIVNTGASEGFLIRRLIQSDEDDYQILNDLCNRYNYTLRRKPSTGLVYFEPKGYTSYPISLNVGTEIPGQIKWKTNMEQLCNYAIVNGATVYDKINPAVFAGPASEFTLLKTPEDTEVRQTDASGALYTRGQKDLGVLGTDFDYYVDVENKKIVFASNKSNIWIRYGAQVPMPVIVKNQTSINAYGGVNKTPHKKKFTFSNLKDIRDAENRGRDIITKYSQPFIEAENIPVKDYVAQDNGVIEPGMLINVKDSFNNKDVNVFVKKVFKRMTSPNDEITIGDELWRTEDWQANTMEKINLLFNELNKNQDILVQTIDLEREATYERRYVYMEKNTPTNAFILGHLDYGVLGTSELGTDAAAWSTIKLYQGNNTYKELIYDEVFFDTVNSTATINTTTRAISFTSGQVLVSEALTRDDESYCTAATITTTNTSGSFTLELSNDGGVVWQEFTDDTRALFTNTSFVNEDSFLLLETGDKILQETGDGILLDQALKARELYYRITENAASTGEITYIQIEYET